MPRFYFHTEDGRFFPDEQGTEFPDVESAKIEAVKVLCDILKDDPQEYWLHEHFAIIVADESKEPLFAINLGPD
jgi:hypothetical protein